MYYTHLRINFVKLTNDLHIIAHFTRFCKEQKYMYMYMHICIVTVLWTPLHKYYNYTCTTKLLLWRGCPFLEVQGSGCPLLQLSKKVHFGCIKSACILPKTSDHQEHHRRHQFLMDLFSPHDIPYKSRPITIYELYV